MQDAQNPNNARAALHSRKSIAHIPFLDVNIDKENLTVDATAPLSSIAQAEFISKKPRSKSIGPGGLDALKEGLGNRRQSATPPFVKSILKPTIPLSPPKQIPPHPSSRRTSPSKSTSKLTLTPEKHQVPVSSDASVWKNSNPVAESHGVPNLFEGPTEVINSQSPSQRQTRVLVRTEAEQEAAAKERLRQEVLAHKDARRRSLANRRVSFAPEATLHTWDVVELPEDSTTSSASTNSTRRASGLSAVAESPYPKPRTPMPVSDASEPPLTPPEQVEEVQVVGSPARQRDLHQRKRRRSSGIPPMNFNNPDDFSSSPGSFHSDDTGTQAFATVDEESESSGTEDNDLVEDESTVTGVHGDDVTTRSNEGSSTASSSKLEEALRQAANQAGTQGIDYDEHGDITMEIADDEVTAAFQPWMRKGNYAPKRIGDSGMLEDQENLNPFSPAFKAKFIENANVEDAERTMDFTQVVGGILQSRGGIQKSTDYKKQEPTTEENRRGSVARRRSLGDGSVFGDETMQLTRAIGGIHQNQPMHEQIKDSEDAESVDEDEDLTMEFTSVVGGVLERKYALEDRNQPLNDDQFANQQLYREGSRCESEGSSYNEEEIDINIAAGGILPSITEHTEPAEDQTIDMDITAAIGAILPENLAAGNKLEAKQLMERETDSGQLSNFSVIAGPPAGFGLPSHTATVASETGSPSLMTSQRRGNPRKSHVGRQSTTPKTGSRPSTPLKKPLTPSKRVTLQLARPTTPGKTPPSRNISMRTGSPKKLFKAEIKHVDSTPQPPAPNPLFRNDGNLTEATPTIILKPHHRRFSGLGIDKEGLGSPLVTALLDKRRSIGEDAKAFNPQHQALKGVRFDDPKVMERELETQRAEDERRETDRVILQRGAAEKDLEDEKDATANLKDKIESLTPQKKKLKGRKSLHVGAAKGVLGKRPIELDEDDEDDEDLTPKRLKGREGSPVKKVRLPAPPSKIETTGRITRSSRLSLAKTSRTIDVNSPSKATSTPKKSLVTTSKDQSSSKDLEQATEVVASLNQEFDAGNAAAFASPGNDDRIHLQDFLNMTSIRFMELTTTKRRLTVAPCSILESSTKKPDMGEGSSSPIQKITELETRVVAGACTVPMLELYQHSCRELKRYIAEGRSIVREIEADTFEENPPLFHEYISAPPEIKLIMDNQFKNIKTHARHLSKAMWYEWRMKLLDGLKDGLLRMSEGVNQDENLLAQQEQLLNLVLPSLIQEHERLETEHHILQAQADELANCDQDELQDARNNLTAVENDLQAKRKMVEALQSELRQKEQRLENTVDRKQQCDEEIKEVEKIREDYRGWSPSEVAILQENVDALEKAHGWTIISAASASLTMTYKRTLQLFFTPASFMATATPTIQNQTKHENSSISLTYIADTHEYHPQPLTTEKRFFLQIMRAQLQCLPQFQTKIKDLLDLVSTNWENACRIVNETRKLDINYITKSTIKADEIMTVRSMLLLRELKTKIDVAFEVAVQAPGTTAIELEVSVKPSARVVYGEGLKEKKMVEFLEQRVRGGKSKLEGGEMGIWVDAVKELQQRLVVARGKR